MVETTAQVSLDSPDHIYLVDHAWTFDTSTARSTTSIPNPLEQGEAEVRAWE